MTTLHFNNVIKELQNLFNNHKYFQLSFSIKCFKRRYYEDGIYLRDKKTHKRYDSKYLLFHRYIGGVFLKPEIGYVIAPIIKNGIELLHLKSRDIRTSPIQSISKHKLIKSCRSNGLECESKHSKNMLVSLLLSV